MEKSNITKWRRRISLWGAMMVILSYLFFGILSVALSDNFLNLIFDHLCLMRLLLFVVAPVMEIIGIVPLMKQPLPERFMHRWVFAWAVRLLLLLVYFSQLAALYVEIMNAYFLS